MLKYKLIFIYSYLLLIFIKGPGVTCGGPGDIEGKCGTGLTCVKGDVRKSNSRGICQ
jgi:hypothetical protein